MRPKEIAGLGLVALVAAGPSYFIERITEYYFLTGNAATFFVWSGERTTLFVALVLLAALGSGYAIRSFPATVAAYTTGIVVLLLLLYAFCITKVCYSTGFDGLEPLRVGFFLSCLGISGIWIGNYARTRAEWKGPWLFVASAAAIGAMTYLPVVFTVAGTSVLAPLAPIPVLVIVGLPSLVFAGRITSAANWKAGLCVSVGPSLLVLVVTLGIAGQYLLQISWVVSLIIVAALAGAIVGCVVATKQSWPYKSLVRSNRLLYVALLVLMLSTVFFMPDAVAGVTPQQPVAGSASAFVIGPSVYAGGFATQSFLRLEGVSVSVSFAGTNVSAIQPDNFLSGGLGVHAAHCCVDGIDFGYRFDAYVFHDGGEALVATSWETCDWNMACGGHSWQDLLFLQERQINFSLASQLHLFLQWKGRVVYWSYSVGGSPASNFTSFSPPAQENSYFTVGTLGEVPASPQPSRAFYANPTMSAVVAPNSPGYYFFQYGLMSKYAIGHPGWQVNFACPSYLDNGSWTCIRHSDSIQGDESYWKVIWRWGNPYDNI